MNSKVILMKELISEYLWALGSTKCNPCNLPNYVKKFPIDYNGEPLKEECVRLYCFIQNHIDNESTRHWLGTAILNWNIKDLAGITQFIRKEEEKSSSPSKEEEIIKTLSCLNDAFMAYPKCSLCNKRDWSDKIGKHNTPPPF